MGWVGVRRGLGGLRGPVRGYNQVRAPGSRGRGSHRALGSSSHAPSLLPQRERGSRGCEHPASLPTRDGAPWGGIGALGKHPLRPGRGHCGLGIVRGEEPGSRRWGVRVGAGRGSRSLQLRASCPRLPEMGKLSLSRLGFAESQVGRGLPGILGRVCCQCPPMEEGSL